MSTTTRHDREQKWAEGYYGALVGLTITKVEIVNDDSMGWTELWPQFTAVDKDGNEFVLELSKDPEGNGAGFLFGLPSYVLPESV